MRSMALPRMMAILFALMACMSPFSSAAADQLIEGYDFKQLARTLQTNPGRKVEVVEFFRYGCPHCNEMMPHIEPWAQRRKSDVTLVRIPFNREHVGIAHQHLYYSLEALGLVEQLHSTIFKAIYEEKYPMDTPEVMADYLTEYGIKRKTFLKIYYSDRVKGKVRKAQELAQAYGVKFVPTIFVDGRYMTSAVLIGGSQKEALRITDQLVNRVLAQRRSLSSVADGVGR